MRELRESVILLSGSRQLIAELIFLRCFHLLTLEVPPPPPPQWGSSADNVFFSLHRSFTQRSPS